jgi:acetyl-CoA synthetase
MSVSYKLKSYEEYINTYRFSTENPETFWSEIATQFHWRKKWDTVLKWEFSSPHVEWFINGKLNITENCLDRYLASHSNVPAIIWEPNDPKEAHRILTFSELHQQVCIVAEVLRNMGVKKGDRICIYMGMIPELCIAALACARIGAIHSIIFGGFSSQSISDRVQDAGAEYIICCDGAFRGHKIIDLKEIVDIALQDCPSIKKVLVYSRTKTPTNMIAGRDFWWHDEVSGINVAKAVSIDAEEMDSEDPLFILYTSGSTGKPKGVVHTCGGYMIYANYSFINVFQYQPGDLHFCTADIGWITGHSYILYGPLSAGASTLMFEGIPTWPDPGRFWDIVDKHKVNCLYTAPTAIRSLMSFGLDPVKNKNLSSLKVLGSVGEPINEEAWHWFHQHIGKSKCPVVDTWWQTETGGILISNLAGVTPEKPSYATLPLPGVQVKLLDDSGNEILEAHKIGYLCIGFPWPGILRTTFGDHERCRKTYFDQFKNHYFTGDGAFRDENGFYRITGRVDDVLKISGHRIGTAEVENVINMHTHVIESAVVGIPHEIKGQAIYAFVVTDSIPDDEHSLRNDIIKNLTDHIGPIAKAEKIQFVSGLPKTRSGKIMRRILRKIAEGKTQELGDTTTLLDPAIVEEIIKGKL